MKVAFLEALNPPADVMPAQYLPDHEVIVAPERGRLPDGYEDAEAIVWSQWPVDRGFIDSLPWLRFLHRIGRFRTRGDVTAALEKGLAVSTTPQGTSNRVAEHTFALILGLARGLLASHASVINGDNPAGLESIERIGATPTVNWARVPGLQSLHFKTVGILGYGEIGSCLAELLAPFHCNVLYNKRNPLTREQERFYGVTYASFEDVLRRSDFVVNLIPVSPETRGILGRAELETMKPSAYIVNCGRGVTFKEDELIEVLREGKIAGAGLDVFEHEPLEPDHPVTKLTNVLLTPHTAGGTPQGAINGLAGWGDTFAFLKENLRRVAAGEPVLCPIRKGDPQFQD